MTVVITHSTPSDSSFSTTGATAWNATHTLSGVGTMAEQNANAVAITGGSISGVSGVVTSVTGTAPVASSGGTTPAISMAAATTSVSGYLTSTDWNTFNGKQPAGTYVTAVTGTSGRTTSSGGTTPAIDLASGVATPGTTGSSTLVPVITIDTYGRVTSITTAANPQGTVTSVTGTAPVVSSGGATPAISMAAATTSVSGYLTSTDWNTFNGKGSGSVTSVGGTGTVNGLSLSGTVTSSGNLTFGGTLNLSSPPAIGGTTPNTSAFTYGTYPAQSAAPSTPAAGFTLYANNSNALTWKGANGYLRTFDGTTNTADRTYTLPNNNGTIALTSNLGTIASQNANAVAVTGGAIDGTTVGATTASTGAFTTLSASSTVSGTGFSTYLASPPAIGGTTASTGRFTTITSTVATGTAPFTVASTTAVANLSIGGNAGTVTNGVYTTDTGTVTNTMLAGSIANAKLTNSSITFGSTAQALGSTVSAISGVTIDNGAIGGTTAAAGTFTTLIGGSGSANYEQITGGATTKAVQFQTLGSDTNISVAIQPKGTGAIDLAAGSSGVNISNGGTVTALTRTNAGANYTTIPSVVISAPTTAGGVQATATTTLTQGGPTIVSGGTGYSVNDVLTLVGGTFTAVSTVTVTAVSGGVITAITNASFGTYTVVPSNPISVTGGTGTGATISTTWVLQNSFTIINAGSGYVEQPTVSFSGGGGSGAAAYATVGSASIIKSIGASTVNAVSAASFVFQTPNTNAPALIIRESAGADSFLMVNPAVGYVNLLALGGSGASLSLYSNGGGNIILGTNGLSNTIQMRVTHTASSVNYIQVTGAATTGSVALSTQGSDANVNLNLIAKGTGVIRFYTAAASSEQFRITHTAGTIVNYATATGAIAGAGAIFGVAGTDADIDLNLTPKGAGAVRFGTYTATVTAVAGYILIKDAGGTTRKLAVLT